MQQNDIIAVIGMGTVGLMIAEAFSTLHQVIGFDIDPNRIRELNTGFDKNLEFSKKEVDKKKLFYTSNSAELAKAKIFIIAVPTLLNKQNKPDFSPILAASKIVAKYLKKNSIVVYESSVYPGVTEDYCIPILEKYSGLQSPKDFGVGFSPERINPGDHVHTELSIHKIVSAQNAKYLKKITELYQDVITAKIIPVKSIKVAEASKILENTLRDVEIAMLNEAAILLEQSSINVHEVIQAMSTKWNYHPIKPGLVGGNCIGINTYYLLDYAKKNKIKIPLIKTARQVNTAMPKYIYDKVKTLLKTNKIKLKNAKIGIMGVTFKADYYALDHTGSLPLINLLKNAGVEILLHDPIAKKSQVKDYFKLELQPWKNLKSLDGIIILLAHDPYKKLTRNKLAKILKPHGFIIDLKGVLERTL